MKKPFSLISPLLFSCCVLAQPRPAANPDRIVGRLDPNQVVKLKGNVHPYAVAGNDQGRVSSNLLLDYVTLHFKPTPSQQADLDQLLKDVQDPTSSLYRKWLTPEQYADRFGASQADIAQVVAWLEGRGLTVIKRARGRNFVVFKGPAGLVEEALHTEIHHFLAKGEVHWANVTEPSVPSAIHPFTIGFSGLDDFKPEPPSHARKPVPAISYNGQNALGPGDLWLIYDIAPFYQYGITGNGMRVAVVGQTDVDLADVATYQSAFGLPANTPTKVLVPGSSYPGVTSGDYGESELDLEVLDAIVWNAQILFVYSTNIVNSLAYVIDEAAAPVVSYSYAGCELSANSSVATGFQQLAQQANAEGITWVAASGDSGAAGCDAGASVATHGISAMLPASVPEVTGVGGTEFSEGIGSYWGLTNGTAGDSALSYIPEAAWNDTTILGSLSASGGGMSMYFPRPGWQSAPGVTPLNARFVPDVAVSASPQHDPYAVVLGGIPSLVGGTSAATPVFAGIILLLNQFFGVKGLGNINPALYALASTSTNVCNAYAVTPKCVFHDVMSGSNFVPCTAGTVGCIGGTMGYAAGPGYDMVTGLGSVDAANLAIAAVTQNSGPSISSVTTAFGGPAIAQNTFIVIKGTNLVPPITPSTGVTWSNSPAFDSGLMPSQLDNVSVTINGKPGFIYFYCSAGTDPACFQDQINVLTPLDNTLGPVLVVVSSGTTSTQGFLTTMNKVAPSFLLASTAGYIVATHRNNSLVGPVTLYPGSSTPAITGETIALFGVGFGLPTTPLVNGSASQFGSLPVLPVCTVGGYPANLTFAGVVSPGLYQLNLTIPIAAANGDNLVSCSYGGFTTPTGDLITVQR